jgi:hypothetical protein
MSQMQPFPTIFFPMSTTTTIRDFARDSAPQRARYLCSPSMVPESAPGAGGPAPAPNMSTHEPVIHQ